MVLLLLSARTTGVSIPWLAGCYQGSWAKKYVGVVGGEIARNAFALSGIPYPEFAARDFECRYTEQYGPDVEGDSVLAVQRHTRGTLHKRTPARLWVFPREIGKRNFSPVFFRLSPERLPQLPRFIVCVTHPEPDDSVKRMHEKRGIMNLYNPQMKTALKTAFTAIVIGCSLHAGATDFALQNGSMTVYNATSVNSVTVNTSGNATPATTLGIGAQGYGMPSF
ncbi:MAG: hypothetical protein SXG53_28345, partial [Pseudomonadota bacterium]|nr:hypothetical protein [Pseudomonadota bacterium]